MEAYLQKSQSSRSSLSYSSTQIALFVKLLEGVIEVTEPLIISIVSNVHDELKNLKSNLRQLERYFTELTGASTQSGSSPSSQSTLSSSELKMMSDYFLQLQSQFKHKHQS